jgi:hypothetical protein
MVALLVALISIARDTAPVMVHLIKGDFSEISVNLAATGDEPYSYLLVTNSGNKPGFITSASLVLGAGVGKEIPLGDIKQFDPGASISLRIGTTQEVNAMAIARYKETKAKIDGELFVYIANFGDEERPKCLRVVTSCYDSHDKHYCKLFPDRKSPSCDPPE